MGEAVQSGIPLLIISDPPTYFANGSSCGLQIVGGSLDYLKTVKDILNALWFRIDLNTFHWRKRLESVKD